MRRPALFAALVLALVWSSSAFALFGNDEAIDQLKKQIQADEQRITKLEQSAPNQSAVLDLSSQIQSLRNDLANLRGQLEVIQHEIESDEKRQKDLYLDIDTRLRRLEQPAEQGGAGQNPAAEAVPTPAETAAYESALNQFRVGKYSDAAAAFEAFLKKYPSSALASSAQYWVGNAHFAQRDYKGAIAAQQKLLSQWPTSPKAPDALLNIASSQDALGDRRAARKTLEALLAKYPGTPAAATAKQRLGGGAKH
jgi:tol-pal system protein YbgF